MPIILLIPESAELRRASAALASPLASSSEATGLNSLDVNVVNYFRNFPWTGVRRRNDSTLPTLESSTVGQYFSVFPWSTVSGVSTKQSRRRNTSDTEVEVNTVSSMEGIFR